MENRRQKFYRDNVEEAENYVYSDIPLYELTYNGVVTNNAGRERASLVNKQKKMYIRTSLTSQLRKASVGEVFLVRVYQQDKKQIALTIHPSGKKVEVTPKKQALFIGNKKGLVLLSFLCIMQTKHITFVYHGPESRFYSKKCIIWY